MRRGRIVIDVRVTRLGSDWCLFVTGGDRPHAGAVGWSGPEVAPTSLDFPHHRDRTVVDVFLKALHPLPGHHVVVAGIHLDGITRTEIDAVVTLCQGLAERVALSLTKEAT